MTTPAPDLAKRAMDVSLSLLALPLAVPLMALIALAVKLDSPGPVWFRQERVGRAGRLFRIHKFRTMRVTDGSGPLVTASHDARITRVGRWLRRTKLDELPQLIDVLKGDMSLVGPRPEVPRYMALYAEPVRRQRRFLAREVRAACAAVRRGRQVFSHARWSRARAMLTN